MMNINEKYQESLELYANKCKAAFFDKLVKEAFIPLSEGKIDVFVWQSDYGRICFTKEEPAVESWERRT